MDLAKRIARQRRKADWKFQYGVLRSAIDWVVSLYIIVPILLILGYHYVALWNVQAEWPTLLPALSMVTFLYILAWMGNARVYVEPADQLFFRQYKWMYSAFIREGLQYSFIVALFTTLCYFLILYPVLYYYHGFTMIEIIFLLMIVYILRVHILLYKQYMDASFKGWKKRGIHFLSWVLGLALFQGIVYLGSSTVIWFIFVIVAMIGSLSKMFHQRLHREWGFEADYVREGEERLKIAKFFLQSAVYIGAPDLQRKKGRTLKKPLFIVRRSRRFIGQHRNVFYFLMLLKYMYRDKQRLLVLSQIVGVSLIGVFLLPENVKYGMWIISILLLVYYHKMMWDELFSFRFLALFQWTADEIYKYGRFALFLITLPLITGISFLTGVLHHSIQGGLLVTGLGCLISFMLTRMFMHEFKEMKYGMSRRERGK